MRIEIQPIPIPAFPLKGKVNNVATPKPTVFILPFKGRIEVGMGLTHDATIIFILRATWRC